MLTSLTGDARSNRLAAPFRRPLEHALFGLLPLSVAALAFYYAFSGGYAAGDFQHSFLVAGWREMHRVDPYRWTWAQIVVARDSFPYPSLAVILFEFFALLPTGLATGVYLFLCVAAFAGALYLMGVRDWRVYGVALMSTPVLIAWQVGNLTLPLAFGVAVAWRYRERPWLVGLVIAVLVSIKPVMAPIGVWLLVTGRYRATVWAVATGAALNVMAWTAIGWDEFGRWLHFVSVQSADLYRTGYSIIALASHLGVGRTAGTAIQVVVDLAVVVCMFYIGRSRRDAAAFVLGVALCLVISPQVDQHYFALLIVPLAMAFPRLGWQWLLPLVLWACPANGGSAWQVGLWLIMAAVTVVLVLRALGDARPEPRLKMDESPRTNSPDSAPASRNPLAIGGHV